LFQIKRKRLIQDINKYNFNAWITHIYLNGEYIQDRSRYLLFDDDLEPIVNYIGRFETLKKDFNEILPYLTFKEVKLQHLNKSNFNNIHYRDWFNQENKKLISKYFDFELDYFKYRY
jgi:hypothetical protein